MTKPLTKGQKKARALVKEAARRVLVELDDMEFRRNSEQFDVHFHLSCWQDSGPGNKVGRPIYVSLTGRT